MSNLKELGEALKYARGLEGISFNHTGVEFDDDDRDALLTLAAEVERLRIERDEWKRLAEEREDAHTRGYRECADLKRFEIDGLIKEAATARLALDVAQKEIERLKAAARPRNVFMECPDCSNATAKGYDIVEGAAHCRFCGHPVDADENAS